MPKADEVRSAKREERKPFSSPAEDEVIEITIPEGAESGQIPKGDQYIGRLMGVIQETSKGSGNPMLTWAFEMYEGEFAGMDFTMWTPLTDNAIWKLSDTLTALGVKWEPGTKVRIDPKALKNTLVRMDIKDDTYEGRTRSKLNKILPHPDGAGTKAAKGGFTVPKKAEEDDEEEEQPQRGTRRARGQRDEEEEVYDDERPKRGRRPAPVEEDDEEEEFPRARGRGRAKEPEEDMEEVWGNGKKGRKPVVEEDDEEERPVRRSGRPVARGRGR